MDYRYCTFVKSRFGKGMIGMEKGVIKFANVINSVSLTIANIANILKGLPPFSVSFSKMSKNISEASTLHFGE